MEKSQNVMESLGKTLCKRRKELHLTQRELAEMAGCGEAFLHLLEHGKETTRFDKVLAVMKVLGLQFEVQEGKDLISIHARLR